MIDVANNLQQTIQEIRQAEIQFHRPPHSVTLLAVCKTQPLSIVSVLIDNQHYSLAENYLQEALAKISALSSKKVIWHYIGQIQTNKIQSIAQNFSWVHTISREVEAKMLSVAAVKLNKTIHACIQVKLDDSTTKGGVKIRDAGALADCIHHLEGLHLRGFMALPPVLSDFEQQRAVLKPLRTLMNRLKPLYPELDTLSMGTSHDWRAAIAEGATIIRIGRKLFQPTEEL